MFLLSYWDILLFLGGSTALRRKSEEDFRTLHVPPEIKVLLQIWQLLHLGYMEMRLFTVFLVTMDTEQIHCRVSVVESSHFSLSEFDFQMPVTMFALFYCKLSVYLKMWNVIEVHCLSLANCKWECWIQLLQSYNNLSKRLFSIP